MIFLCKNNIINNYQIGFTKNARRSDHMFIIKCIIDKYCKTKDGKVYACFVDFQKAFDTVIHTVLKSNFSQSELVQSFTKLSKTCMK